MPLASRVFILAGIKALLDDNFNEAKKGSDHQKNGLFLSLFCDTIYTSSVVSGER